MANYPSSHPSATPSTHGEVVDELRAVTSTLGLNPQGAASTVADRVAGKADATHTHPTAAHTHPVTDLTATGTPSSSTFLRGDGTWSTTPAAQGAVDASTTTKGLVQLAGDLSGTAAAPTVPALAGKAPLANPTFTGTVAGVTKAMVGLGSVDNTADTAKPVSTAQQTALNGKVTAVTANAKLWIGTQAAYDAIGTKDATTLYVVT